MRWAHGWRLALLLFLCVGCIRVADRPIVIRDAWSRESPALSQTGGVFMTIENHGSTADVLLGAATSVCRAVELHESVLDGDVMKMRPVERGRIEVPAGEIVELKPGGLHIMLIGLMEKLEVGKSFVLTLEFEQAGMMEVEVAVRQAGALETGQ